MSFYANEVANELNDRFITYLRSNPLGRSRVEQVFEIPLPDDDTRIMRPDLAYVSYERWPKDRPIPLEGLGFDVVPEWVIEVVSPSDKAEDVVDKTREYFRGGVSVVWQIYPMNRVVYVFDGVSAIRVFDASQELPTPFLPGFSVKLAEILPAVAESE